MKKNQVVTLITGTEQTRRALLGQIMEFLPKEMKVFSYAIDEGLPEGYEKGLTIVSSQVVLEELEELGKMPEDKNILVAKRTINYNGVAKILRIPKGTEVLFVNDVEETALEAIDSLMALGLDEISYLPYYPGKNLPPDRRPEIAITPGEGEMAPAFIKTVYDIGPRELDFTTITEILNRLNLLDQKAGELSRKYLSKIIAMSKEIAEYSNQVIRLNWHLNSVIDGLSEGLLVYDPAGIISVFNENLQAILGCPGENYEGKRLKDVLYHKPLIAYLMDPGEIAEQIVQFNGSEVVVKKIHLKGSDSYVATFKNVKEAIESNDQLKRDLIKKGHFAKYSFGDIIGHSEKLQRAKEIVGKLADTDLTILMQGESGTGKELFASAIHNASKRAKQPFLAANFSALPDELIESELFGYEEGAFTGAKKGGKIGLFQQAEGGTIFLDEIGDVTLKLQARLLRVLQEKEIMPIGGHTIKSVDVRVIAATNKDLVTMVKEGKFRQDLYYRLKMGYIQIPSLRERKEDIRDLVRYIVGTESKEPITIKEDVIQHLLNYDWPGNVRELKNTLEYMLAIRDGDTLEVKDIPEAGFFMGQNLVVNGGEQPMPLKTLNKDPRPDEILILEAIYRRMEKGELAGREILSKDLEETEFPLTPSQVRNRLERLESLGLIIKKRGKHGTVLTEGAMEYVEGS